MLCDQEGGGSHNIYSKQHLLQVGHLREDVVWPGGGGVTQHLLQTTSTPRGSLNISGQKVVTSVTPGSRCCVTLLPSHTTSTPELDLENSATQCPWDSRCRNFKRRRNTIYDRWKTSLTRTPRRGSTNMYCRERWVVFPKCPTPPPPGNLRR